jgi:predicted nucleotidyltransferase
MSRIYAFEDHELENYRKMMIMKVSKATWLKEVCESTLGRECSLVSLVGSVLDPRLFHDSSDIDVAFSLKPQPGEREGLDEDLSYKLQLELTATPLEGSVLNSLVFVGPIKTRTGKTLQIVPAVDSARTRSDPSLTESRLRQMIREALLKASDLDADGAARLLKYVDAADRHPEFAGYDLVKGGMTPNQISMAVEKFLPQDPRGDRDRER